MGHETQHATKYKGSRSLVITLNPGLTFIVILLPPTLIAMPYCVGLESAANAFLAASFPTQLALAVAIFLAIVISLSALQQEPADAPTSLPCSSLFAITPFFRQRYNFLNWGFHATGQSVFKFNLLRVRLQSFHAIHKPNTLNF